MHTGIAFGQNSILDAAAMAPANTAFLTPTLHGYPLTAIPNFPFEQELGAGYAATFGNFNVIDLWSQFYPDYGQGRDGFMHINSIIFLNVVPTLPIVFNGAGVIKAGDTGSLSIGIRTSRLRSQQTGESCVPPDKRFVHLSVLTRLAGSNAPPDKLRRCRRKLDALCGPSSEVSGLSSLIGHPRKQSPQGANLNRHPSRFSH